MIKSLALIAATLIGLYLCYLLVLPFLPALVWALTIAVLAAPLHRRLERALRRPNLAGAISVALLGLVVLVPLSVLAQHLVGVLSTGIANGQQRVEAIDFEGLAETYPLVGRAAALIDGGHLTAIFGQLGTWATNFATAVVKGSLSNGITMLLTFYLLFYFLRDRREILRQARALSPFTSSETNHLFGRVADTIHGVIFGTVIAAVVQGVLGGLIFWLLGLPNPLFWGVVMAVLAVVPILGAFVVWIPAAAYLALTGAWWQAVVLAVYGIVVIGLADNILHPVLAGSRLRLHTVLALISIVGGLMLFGPSGLILGPLAVTLTIAVLEIWRERRAAGP